MATERIIAAGGRPALQQPEDRRSAELGRMLEQVRLQGLAAYAKQNLPARPETPRMQNWINSNPRLMQELESDLRRNNLFLSSGPKPAQPASRQQFDSVLGLWLGARYAAARYKELPMPKPVGVEKKPGNLALCAEDGKGPGPAAVISFSQIKGGAPRMNASLAFAVRPWLDGAMPASVPVQKEPTLKDLQEELRKPSFDTEFFTQYLMRMNSISSPEVKAKISNIFLRLGAIVKDNPKLAFGDFIGKFVVEMNREFGSTMAFGVPRRPVRADARKSANSAAVPKKTSGSGGGGKPPAA